MFACLQNTTRFHLIESKIYEAKNNLSERGMSPWYVL